jgi:hypothetical protein
MSNSKLSSIALRLVILSVLVVCLLWIAPKPIGIDASARPCCSPCFDCYDSCYQLPTNEEMNACYAYCQQYFCTNPYCDPNC